MKYNVDIALVVLEKWDKPGYNIGKNKTFYSDKWKYILVSYMY